MVTPVEVKGRKLNGLRNLLRGGNNIVSSHALLENYTNDMLEYIRKYNYTLFIDEAYEAARVLDEDDLGSFRHFLANGEVSIDKRTSLAVWESDKCYDGTPLEEIVNMIKTHNILYVHNQALLWIFPVEILLAFKNVIVLTYKFNVNPLSYYFDIHDIKYQFIGVKKVGERNYVFCPVDEADDDSMDIISKVHVVDVDKLNSIGDDEFDLSVNWGRKDIKNSGGENLFKLGKNIQNVQKNIFKCSAKDFIWTFYDKKIQTEFGLVSMREFVSDKNIKKSFLACNARAQNRWGDRHYLAYCVNLQIHPSTSTYFKSNGILIDKDGWALVNMLQWIWRSAIRNGEEIWIYIPSMRMRGLFCRWVEDISKGGEQIDI